MYLPFLVISNLKLSLELLQLLFYLLCILPVNILFALCQVYTFGPTFRAENSNTSRHLAEFWVYIGFTKLLTCILPICFLFTIISIQELVFMCIYIVAKILTTAFFSQDDRTRTCICWSRRWHGLCNCISPVCSRLPYKPIVLLWFYRHPLICAVFLTLACLSCFVWQVKYVLENCKEDMDFFNTWIEKGIIDRLSVWVLTQLFGPSSIFLDF